MLSGGGGVVTFGTVCGTRLLLAKKADAGDGGRRYLWREEEVVVVEHSDCKVNGRARVIPFFLSTHPLPCPRHFSF